MVVGYKEFFPQSIKFSATEQVKKFKLFGKSEIYEILVDRYRYETKEEILERINTFINTNNLEILNIETIFSCTAKGYYNTTSVLDINNRYVEGFRIFYKASSNK